MFVLFSISIRMMMGSRSMAGRAAVPAVHVRHGLSFFDLSWSIRVNDFLHILELVVSDYI